ncbi:MAG: hypothetical protein H8E03_00660 [Pelagibacteraceae bacterium]|nr:hypothetical protein [Pelagibacteraceae bacterium]
MSKRIKLKQLAEQFISGGMVSTSAFDSTGMFKTKISTENTNTGRLSSFISEEDQLDEVKFLDEVKNFGTLGSEIYRENDLRTVAERLSYIAKCAKTHTLRETDEWFDKITINRNMKELSGLSGQFNKIANEAQSLQERMSGLYEDMGHILGRYYEINEETGDKAEYQKFFQAALKKFGSSSPDQMDDEKKKAFFNFIDKNWQGDNEND